MTGLAIRPRKSFSSINPKLQIAWDSVSSTAAKTCWRKYQLAIIEGWRPKHESHHLRYGQLYHRALEVYDHKTCDGLNHEDALKAALRDLAEGCQNTEFVNDLEAPAGPQGEIQVRQVRSWWNPHEHLHEEKAKRDKKTIPNLFRTVIWYLDQFGVNDACKTVILSNGKPAVELSFRYELGHTFGTGEELLHSGHIDRLVTLGEAHYVLDRKTTGTTISGASAYNYFAKFNPDNQMTGYTFAGKVALLIPVVGVIIDAAQIAEGFSRFERGFTMRTDNQLEEWRTDFIMMAKDAERYAQADYWPMNDTACDNYGGCTFRGICSKDPMVREIFLKTDFIKQPWDPLEVRGDI